MEKTQSNWQTTFAILCFLLISLNIYLIAKDFDKSGWDFEAYCGAVKAVTNNKDPYYIENIKEYSGRALRFWYMPITIPFFRALCTFDSKTTYYFVWTFLLIAAFLITIKSKVNHDFLLLVTLLLTSFKATYWNFLTGNIGIIELFLFSITYYFLIKKRHELFAVFLTLTCIWKLLPLIFTTLFIFARVSLAKKVKIISIILLTFILISATSYFMFPDISPSYYALSLGKLEAKGGPLSHGSNDGAFFLIKQIVEALLGKNLAVSLILFFLFAASIGTLFLKYVLIKERKFVELFSFGCLAILIILPRLRPYSFALAILPVYFLIKDFDAKNRFNFLFIVSVLPMVLDFELAGFLRALPFGFVWEHYTRLLSLILFFIYFLKKSKTIQFHKHQKYQ